MASILNIISFVATLMASVGILYLIQEYTLGFIPKFNKATIFGKLYLKDVVFLGVALFIVLRFTTFYIPY